MKQFEKLNENTNVILLSLNYSHQFTFKEATYPKRERISISKAVLRRKAQKEITADQTVKTGVV